jgi:hypothetical protein
VISGGMWVNLYYADEGRTTSDSWSPYVNIRASSRFTVNLGAGLSHNHDNTQWFGNFTTNGVTHYSFAHLDQLSRSSSIRINYTHTPNLTFEFYGEPFTTTGTYTNVREVSATPRADSYDARFTAYNAPAEADRQFRFTQLRTNSVVRWEYRPASTLFLVWAHGRQASASDAPSQSWSRDYRDLFALHPDNTFLIKVAYWMSR